MHLAMHDALNAIVPIYEAYAYAGGPRLAHPIAAAAQAAHDVLVAQYPDQQAKLGGQLAALARARPRRRSLRERGIALGRAPLRPRSSRGATDDGWDFPGTLRVRRGSRPVSNDPARGTASSRNRDFGSRNHSSSSTRSSSGRRRRRRCEPPRTPARSAKSRSTAQRTARARTDDQTAYAVWWMEFAEGSVNRLARQLAADRQTASLEGGPPVRARRRGALRHLRRDLGLEIRLRSLASVHGHSSRGHRRESAHDARPCAGSRCVRRRRFPSTSRLTRRPAAPRLACSSTASGTACRSRWRRRPPHQACPRERSPASMRRPRSVRIHG